MLGDDDAQKYTCIDEPYVLKGNYDDPSASNLIVTFELCSLEKRSTCKSDKEISEALDFSYLITYENGQIYNHEEYPGSLNYIKSVSNIRFYPVNSDLS